MRRVLEGPYVLGGGNVGGGIAEIGKGRRRRRGASKVEVHKNQGWRNRAVIEVVEDAFVFEQSIEKAEVGFGVLNEAITRGITAAKAVRRRRPHDALVNRRSHVGHRLPLAHSVVAAQAHGGSGRLESQSV